MATSTLILGSIPLLGLLAGTYWFFNTPVRFFSRRYRPQAVANQAQDAYFVINPETWHLQHITPRVAQITGYTLKEMQRQSPRTLLKKPAKREFLRLLHQAYHHGQAQKPGFILHTGRQGPYTGNMVIRRQRHGAKDLLVGWFSDYQQQTAVTAMPPRRNYLQVLHELALDISRHQELQPQLDACLHRIIETAEASAGAILLLRHQGRQLRLYAQQGLDTQTQHRLDTLDPQGPWAKQLLKGTSQQNPTQPPLPPHMPPLPCQHWQSAPIAHEAETLGLLWLGWDHNQPRPPELQAFLKPCCSHLSIAVERCRIYDELYWQNRLTNASNRELKRSRRQLQQQLRRLEEANHSLEDLEHSKNQFLSLASHELRTPLTYISTASGILDKEKTDLPPNSQTALKAISEGTQRLQDIVNNLLEIAQIEVQALYLAQEELDLPQLLEELRLELTPLLQQRQLQWDSSPCAPSQGLLGDRYHLKRALYRLVSNAIKFTPAQGSIHHQTQWVDQQWLESRRDKLEHFHPHFFHQSHAPWYYLISLQDSGVGIAPEEQARIFSKFYEAGDIRSHFTSKTSFGGKGVGLGLSLVKGIIEAHGGMVWVESDGPQGPRRGSCFHMVLPCSPAPSAQGPVTSDA